MTRTASQTSARYSYPTPGELNKRVHFRQIVDVPALDFGTDAEEVASFTAWAKVAQAGAAVYQSSVQTEEKTTHYVTVRYRPALSADWELVVNGEVMKIRRLRDLNMTRRFWLLECESMGVENPGGAVYG